MTCCVILHCAMLLGMAPCCACYPMLQYTVSCSVMLCNCVLYAILYHTLASYSIFGYTTCLQQYDILHYNKTLVVCFTAYYIAPSLSYSPVLSCIIGMFVYAAMVLRYIVIRRFTRCYVLLCCKILPYIALYHILYTMSYYAML